MKADLDISGYQPELATGQKTKQFTIRCEIVDQLPEGPRRSGKYIHLGLTSVDAMRLLALLQKAQEALSLPIPTLEVSMIKVPRAKARH